MVRNVPAQLSSLVPRREEKRGIRKNEPPSNVYSSNRVLDREPFEDWYGMSNTVSRVEDDSCCPAGGVAVRQIIEQQISSAFVGRRRKRRQKTQKTHRARIACTLIYIAGTLKVSKKICAACSRFELGFKGASVRRTGC